ncbi:acetylxylan esterase [Allorhizocola rhizosphaerae]|uniref:acetylxylan esterase n=1 Tax=Allorhizocola rhizosphaerae TaxID=1872709 RepID=UPI00319DF244
MTELEVYRPERDEPDDFDAFWAETLSGTPEKPVFEPYDSGLSTVDVWDVTFPGFGGDPIRGWLIRPRNVDDPLPGVVTYIGYAGGRGLPHDWLVPSAAGYANLVMDNRGQGAMWVPGDTPDASAGPLDPQYPGFMTRGVRDPSTYYYRRLITDAVRAVDALRAAPGVDPSRIAVSGGSQGGGLALAAAGLSPHVKAALIDVPFLCHWRRAIDIATDGPYPELVSYCAIQRHDTAKVLHTLSYVDGVNFAARASATALFSVGLMDPVCPPSTVYAAYNHYAGPKRMNVWHYNGHEGGQTHQIADQLRFLASAMA